MFDLTGFQRDLLYVVAGLDQPSGLDVKDELEAYYGTEINHGRLYPNLDSLVEADLLEKGQHDRRTNFYVLTDSGASIIDDRTDWEDRYLPFEDEATAERPA